MSDILVVGSVALDSVKTTAGKSVEGEIPPVAAGSGLDAPAHA